MNLLPKRWSFESEKNGTAQVWQWLGYTEVYARGLEQSGSYVTSLWRHALKKVPYPKQVQSVLILGVCLGDNIRLAQRLFVHANIVAIEWDQTMVDLALVCKRFEPVQIIVGDLRTVLPTLDQTFDVILGDAFYSDNPNVHEADPTFGHNLSRVLAPGGMYILNAAHQFESMHYVARFLKLQKQWRFRANRLALFIH
jgi:spermidine synthase